MKSQNKENMEILKDIPYVSATGSLIYATTCTRFDIDFVVNKPTQFIAKSNTTHWSMVKRIFVIYNLPTIMESFIVDQIQLLKVLECWDWTGNTKSCKSTTGYMFTLGGRPIIWQSKKQTIVALSSTAVEYFLLLL